MDPDFKVFDFHRIFIGDFPPLFLLEIVFRTVVMYFYTIFLLRLMGKRGMGQLSVLELAIIISFGSAIGDPMIGADVPIVHGAVAVTIVAFLQNGMERLINKSKKVETFMEGAPELIVEDGLIRWECLLRDNLSKEDLFRALRGKEVEHLGQINKAFSETSGKISVLFHSPQKVKPGLSVLPENEISPKDILKKSMRIKKAGSYCCLNCGNCLSFAQKEFVPICEVCQHEEWLQAST
jgi:uncharacterized membrane protein YcaP (DUF421 family)